MCTAISLVGKRHYFGRTLDLEHRYDERVVITPRRYRFRFRYEGDRERGYAMIGMATVASDYPLYYDAVNECGLCMAGLNFVHSAEYSEAKYGRKNLAPHELIPYILGGCTSVEEARQMLENINITPDGFNKELGCARLHWIVADARSAIAAEQSAQGMRIYENALGVLANEPPFDWHLKNLAGYVNLTADVPINRFAPDVELPIYSKGMGAIGLPGDVSSASRFVRAAFLAKSSVCEREEDELSQFFHVLSSVEQIRGEVKTQDGCPVTHYTSCCDSRAGIYYYTTYYNRRISAVEMKKVDIDGEDLIAYPLSTEESIFWQN